MESEKEMSGVEKGIKLDFSGLWILTFLENSRNW